MIINANRSCENPILSRLLQEIGPQAFSTQVNNSKSRPDLHVNPIKPSISYLVCKFLKVLNVKEKKKNGCTQSTIYLLLPSGCGTCVILL